MVEPTQKRRKNWGVGADLTLKENPAKDFLKFRTTHPTNPANVDLTEFAIGMQIPRFGGKRKWKGPFEGRRKLIEELAPYIRIQYGDSSVSVIGSLLNCLRIWWRLLDKSDEFAPVITVADFDDFHGAWQMRDGVSGDYTSQFLRLVNAARYDRGLVNLIWVKNERRTQTLDVPKEEHVRVLYQTLKRRVFCAIDRWRAFDALVLEGKDWSGCMHLRPQSLKWTLADSIATLNGVSAMTGHPCPSRRTCASVLKLQSVGSKFFGYYQEIVFGQFPSRNDVQDFLMMLLLLTGWNGETAISIDGLNIDETIRMHPVSAAHILLYSNKGRGNTQQVAIGLERSDLSPANLISILVKRTGPLREFLTQELNVLGKRAVNASSKDNERAFILKNQIASVWLHVQRDDSEISALNSQNYALGHDGKKSAMLYLIQETNSKNRNVVVPETLKLSDFRDAFISFVYKYSGHSWLETQLAAGHTSPNSLTTYLRKRRWKTHGEGRVVEFMEHLWGEVKSRRIADPAVLRALVERGEITEEQRVRWMNHKDRTRIGTGCRDSKKPPKYIAPEHIDGQGCVVHRCTLCHLAVIFEDSLDHLARRLAELLWHKSRTPLNSWYQSSFPLEVQATEFSLENFPQDKVSERLEFWGQEISTGRHIPIMIEGEYGPSN